MKTSDRISLLAFCLSILSLVTTIYYHYTDGIEKDKLSRFQLYERVVSTGKPQIYLQNNGLSAAQLSNAWTFNGDVCTGINGHSSQQAVNSFYSDWRNNIMRLIKNGLSIGQIDRNFVANLAILPPNYVIPGLSSTPPIIELDFGVDPPLDVIQFAGEVMERSQITFKACDLLHNKCIIGTQYMRNGIKCPDDIEYDNRSRFSD